MSIKGSGSERGDREHVQTIERTGDLGIVITCHGQHEQLLDRCIGCIETVISGLQEHRVRSRTVLSLDQMNPFRWSTACDELCCTTAGSAAVARNTGAMTAFARGCKCIMTVDADDLLCTDPEQIQQVADGVKWVMAAEGRVWATAERMVLAQSGQLLSSTTAEDYITGQDQITDPTMVRPPRLICYGRDLFNRGLVWPIGMEQLGGEDVVHWLRAVSMAEQIRIGGTAYIYHWRPRLDGGEHWWYPDRDLLQRWCRDLLRYGDDEG